VEGGARQNKSCSASQTSVVQTVLEPPCHLFCGYLASFLSTGQNLKKISYCRLVEAHNVWSFWLSSLSFLEFESRISTVERRFFLCSYTTWRLFDISSFFISMRVIFRWSIITQWTEVQNPGGRFAIFYIITTFWITLGPLQCPSTRIKSTGAWCWPLIAKRTFFLLFYGTFASNWFCAWRVGQ